MSDIARVGVIGCGLMGSGIAEVFARAGLDVLVSEASGEALEFGRTRLTNSLETAVKRGKLTTEQRDDALARLAFTTDLADFADRDLVVEAVAEREDIKVQIFQTLDQVVERRDAILASNTSSIPIVKLAAATSRPEQVIGLHFFNPAPVQKLVEVIPTLTTSAATTERVETFATQVLAKEPIRARDRAGFVVNALLVPYLLSAVRMFESGVATASDIDKGMEAGCAHPMGPLRLCDLIGLDTIVSIAESMYDEYKEPLYAAPPLLSRMVDAGLLGRKSGRGFYTYEAPGSSRAVDAATGPARAEVPGREVRSVGVCGSGTMATGIVEVFAKAGYRVLLAARSPEKAERAKAQLAKSLERSVSKGRLAPEQRDAALELVTPVGQYTELADVDLVVEAVAEDLQVKRELFATLDKIVKPGAVLATTTSSLPVISCASATSRPQDVIGMHFFNPAPAMRLVEVVSTVLTAPDVTATVLELCARVKKHPVECGDRAGFIVNALLFPYLNDAVRMLQEHYATVDDIDTAMKLGCGYPMGPFELLDVVGLDVSLTIEKVLHQEFREPGLAAAPLLEHLVAAGCLGRKTGRGFRDHARR